jgi:hypothetical protein
VGRHHGRQLGRAQARATEHKTRRGLTLRDLEDKGNPFCKLTTKETVEGERATVMWFGRCLVMVSRPPLVLRLQGAAIQLCLATLKLLLVSIASDVHESSSCGNYLCALVFGACGTKFNEFGPLFIGLLGPTCRGDEVLRFLYTNQCLTRLYLGDFWKGMDSS